MGDVGELLSVNISDYELEFVHEFVYLGFTNSDTLSLEAELNIGKAATTISRQIKRAWAYSKLTEHAKAQIYVACVVSTPFYGSKVRTLRSRQKRKLSAFYMHCLRRILNISWKDHIPNSTVLERARVSFIITFLKQRRMRWLGHVTHMKDGRIPKNLLYRELEAGKRATGRSSCALKTLVNVTLGRLQSTPKRGSQLMLTEMS
ncbi:uncharacterized protein LOC143034461 [Oratosquilla oratoria]|uniref:uncharacterized protein LOC143034461 n=1 Tax=Oratosquilla oratoria TaxID=337810 RepID=UPI003F76E201